MNNAISIIYLVEDLSDLYSFESFNFIREFKESEFENEPPILITKVDGLEVELIVGYDKNSNDQAVSYFKKFADKLVEVEDLKTIAKTYNKLFLQCSNEYVCVINNKTFVGIGWLNELYAYSKLIDKVGCVSLVSNLLSCEYISLLSSDGDNMVGVYLPKQEYFDVFGILFFARQHLYFVGALDENEDCKNYVFEQWQMRCARMGFNNFAVPNETCIYFPKNVVNRTNTELNKVSEGVETMRKNKNFYIPLETL